MLERSFAHAEQKETGRGKFLLCFKNQLSAKTLSVSAFCLTSMIFDVSACALLCRLSFKIFEQPSTDFVFRRV